MKLRINQAKTVSKKVDKKYLLTYDKFMANQINPKWYEPRQCFRSRKTINGKVRTFYGGSGGSGSFDREANAQAVLQIKKQIDAAQREVDDVKADVHQRLVNIKDSIVLSDANERATVQSFQAVSDGKPPPGIPLLAEMREMREQLEQLHGENALLRLKVSNLTQQLGVS